MALQDLSSDELSQIAHENDQSLVDVPAPNNTVYHEPSDRVLSVPQGLNAHETQYTIDKEIDGKKDFFAQTPVTPEQALYQLYQAPARRVAQMVGRLPSVAAELGVEQVDHAKEDMVNGKFQKSFEAGIFGLPRVIRDIAVGSYGADEMNAKLLAVQERNKALLDKHGLNDQAGSPTARFVADLGGVGASLAGTIGTGMALKSAKLALLIQSAFAKSDAYKEGKDKGLSSDDASTYSNQQFAWNYATESIGTGYMFAAIAENTAFKAATKGVLTEFSQEGGQQLGQDKLSNYWGITNFEGQQMLENAAYAGLLGGITGGAMGASGHALQQQAQEAGLDDNKAKDFVASVEKHTPLAKQDILEFLDKEVAPIANQDEGAATFMQLMQKFHNDPSTVDESQFSPAEKQVFDHFVQIFNASVSNPQSVQAVEKSFYDKAITAGVEQDQAVAASKLIGARADAAARALEITPMEWYQRHNLDLEVQRTPEEAVKAYGEKLTALKEADTAAQPPAATPEMDQRTDIVVKTAEVQPPEPPPEGANQDQLDEYQRRLDELKAPAKDVSIKKPIIQYIKELGGIHPDGLIAQELKWVGINTKTAPALFKRNEHALRDLDNIPVEDFNKRIGESAQDDGNGYVDRNWLIGALRDEQFGKRMGQEAPQHDESFMKALDEAGLDYKTATAQQVYDALGVDGDIQAAAREVDVHLQPKDIRQIRGIMQDNPQMDPRDAIDDWVHRQETSGDTFFQKIKDHPDQTVLKGAEAISDKQLAERKMEEALRSSKEQQGMDFGLFGDEHKQRMLFQESSTPKSTIGDKQVDLLQGRRKNGGRTDAGNLGIGPYAAISENVAKGYGTEISPIIMNIGNPITVVRDNNYQANIQEVADKLGVKAKPEWSGSKQMSEEFSQEFTDRAKAAGYDGAVATMPNGDIIEVVSYNPKSVSYPPPLARGAITFNKDSTVIHLFKDANPSTLFHELGHLFLRDMSAIASESRRPMVRNDFEIIKKWLGAKSNQFNEAQEEQFARGFEAYLREGKAPKPELQSVFDRFKAWLTSIYKSVKDLNVELSPEVRQVFDRMLGGDFSRTQQEIDARQEEQRMRDYELVATAVPKSTFWADTLGNFQDSANLGADAFVPISTRLGNIDVRLKHAVRKFVFRTGLTTNQDQSVVKGFISKVSDDFSEGDYRIMDLALKNRDTAMVDKLVKQYGIEKEWAAMRGTLDEIYNEAKDVGLDLGYVEDYFPRHVKPEMALEYMAHLRGLPVWSEIKLALEEKDPNGEFTPEERAEFANNYLRGFTSNTLKLQKPTFAEARSVDYVTPEANRFYDDSMQTLIRYIGGLRHGIEARKLFGKSEKNTDKNIGSYVLKLIEEGVIDPKQEKELRQILKAVVEPTGTRGVVGWAKNASYIYLMGSPISAITQIQDLAFSLAFNGYYRTGRSLVRSLTGNQLMKKEDIGIDNILEEYSSNSRASKAVRATFKAVGITSFDNIGKEVYIDAAYSRLQAANKKGGEAWNEQVQNIFGVESEQFKKDLANNVMSENVKYMLFSELSDVQPISLAEMPRGYLRGGNGRIFYMLKTYTIKQIDIYRRSVYSEIASGDPKRMVTGTRNLIHLTTSLMLLGMGSDALKDLILGRKIDMNYLAIDNLLKLAGFSKYQIYKSRQEGLLNTFWQTLFVPSVGAPIDDLAKDIRDIGINGKKKFKDAELFQRIPAVGKFYYWWWGGGHTKEEKKAHKPA